MGSRLAPPRRPVELQFDSETLVAEQGEPIAFALLAADKIALSRSPKLHRPHGPYCLRGGCDGCLARVNGEPNVMTCMVACQGGERVETQNVWGSRQVDLLQLTDWFFPQGIDHHHLLAGVPAASFILQKLARHVAGLGRLPDEAPIERARAREANVDVLVIGAGAAGLAVSGRLSQMLAPDLRLLMADDAVSPGGSMQAQGTAMPDMASLDLLTQTTAVGVYERDVLLIRGNEAILVKPRALVLATGAHDGVLAFPGNDLPGVMSARAGALLAQNGIVVGRRVALVGDGPYRRAFLERMGDKVDCIDVPAGATFSAEGRGRLVAITVNEAKRAGAFAKLERKKQRHTVDALLVEAKGAPSFELAEQAGARVAFDPGAGGYLPYTSATGRATEWLWCAGELAGRGPSLADIEEQADAVARDVASALAVTPR